VVTDLPLPDTSVAGITVESEVRNTSQSRQQGVLRGSFEGVAFEQPVMLNPGEARKVVFSPAAFPQLSVKKPRLWWPNGYGKPELYHLQLSFVSGDNQESDRQSIRFGIRELSYEMGIKMPDGKVRRFEYSRPPPGEQQAGSGYPP